MELPAQTDLPFFAYGLFKPGQLGFLQVKDLVSRAHDTSLKGVLRIRDGLPIADLNGNSEITGSILDFKTGLSTEAYERIVALEPEKQYRWETITVADQTLNVLAAISPNRGSVPSEGEWDGKNDPLFTAALEVIEEQLGQNGQFEWDYKPFFRLQMAYLLLWSAIERYVSLRYHLKDKVMEKVAQLAEDTTFQASLKKYVHEKRSVFRADDPQKKVELDPNSPHKAVLYYYQVRSNMTHRGKAAGNDYDTVLNSLDELLKIFRDVKKNAFEESRWDLA
jgi:hypothetical protein